MLQYRIVATPKKENILVEREMHVQGDKWQVVGRYTTTNLRQLPKNPQPWMTAFVNGDCCKITEPTPEPPCCTSFGSIAGPCPDMLRGTDGV